MCPAERRTRRQRGFSRDQFARAASSAPKNFAMARAAAWLAPRSLEWVKEWWEQQQVWVFRMQPRSQFQGQGKRFVGFSWKLVILERDRREASPRSG